MCVFGMRVRCVVVGYADIVVVTYCVVGAWSGYDIAVVVVVCIADYIVTHVGGSYVVMNLTFVGIAMLVFSC